MQPFPRWFWAYASNILLHHVLLITSLISLGLLRFPTEASRLPRLQIFRMFLNPISPPVTNSLFFHCKHLRAECCWLPTSFSDCRSHLKLCLSVPKEWLSLTSHSDCLILAPRATDTSRPRSTIHTAFLLQALPGAGDSQSSRPSSVFFHCLVFFSLANFRVSSFSHLMLWMIR